MKTTFTVITIAALRCRAPKPQLKRRSSSFGSFFPERELNLMFEEVIGEGTDKEFELKHNRDWSRHTRPILEAFCHAKFMIEMAVRYADLPKPPQPMPSGWAALLYLYDLR